MSGLADARVLAAFAQGLARPYMLGVEQRLTEAGSQLGRVTGGAAGLARLNHAYVRTTTGFSTTSSTAVDVTGLSLDFTTYGGTLLLIATGEWFYVDASAGATGEFGFSIDGGADEWVWLHDTSTDTDTYGLAAIRAFSAAPGRHSIKGRAKVGGGTLNVSAGSDWPLFMMAVEL